MSTENLQEMIQQHPGNPIEFNEPDYVYTLPRKKLMYDDIKNETPDGEIPVEESTITRAEIAIESATTEVNTSNYQPESEEALIAYTTGIHNKVQTFSIGGYWEIGRTINSFYQGKYGTKELETISVATGIGRDTLNKMCKFAKQYSRDQVETLLSGTFPVSWSSIAQNLSVAPDKMIQVYQETGDPKQFHNGIMKLKDQSEVRGKSKNAFIAMPPQIIETKPIEHSVIAAVEIIPEESIPAEYDEPADEIDPNELAQQYEAYAKELETLKAKNEELKQEILSKDVKVRELEKTLSDVKREKEQYENSYYAYMHRLDKIRAGLESNTPSRVMMDWIDHGDDE